MSLDNIVFTLRRRGAEVLQPMGHCSNRTQPVEDSANARRREAAFVAKEPQHRVRLWRSEPEREWIGNGRMQEEAPDLREVGREALPDLAGGLVQGTPLPDPLHGSLRADALHALEEIGADQEGGVDELLARKCEGP